MGGSSPARPDIDAVFAASDLMAAGALRVLDAAGRRVPDDVALVGYDDSPIAPRRRPLTSVRQPIEEMGAGDGSAAHRPRSTRRDPSSGA